MNCILEIKEKILKRFIEKKMMNICCDEQLIGLGQEK
jgi:hypothetical protein